MTIKRLLQKIIPSYRIANQIEDKLDRANYRMSYRLESLGKRTENIENKIEYLFFLSQKLPNEDFSKTKERVFLDMPKATGELRYIQLAENFLLQRIKKHTDELGIDFFLVGGTALGAVRHRGFIPWDDDIDIGMLQSDYYLLKNKIDSEDDLITVNRYYQDDGGSLVKVKFKFSENVFVDIFTFDIVNVDESYINEFWENSQRLTTECSRAVKNKMAEMNLLEKASKAPVYETELDIFAKMICRETEEKLLANNGKGTYLVESIANGYWFRDTWKYWGIDEVFPLLANEVEFEGKRYSVINEYKKQLNDFYGDIYALPQSIKCTHNSEFNDELCDDINILLKMGILS